MLKIEALRSLKDVAPLRAEIDALDLASRRPCPFATYEYIEAWLAHDEYGARDDEVLFLAAFEDARLVGYLPLRKHGARMLGVPYRRIDVLVWHDTDRPHVVARPDDEARCADAFYRHLLERERGWSLLELAMQDADSKLSALPPLSARFYARRFENMPNTTLPLAFRGIGEYFDGLAPGHRKNVARLARRLFAAGSVAAVACTDPRGRADMLALYLDLERRSWKQAAHAGIDRDPRRVEFFEALCEPDQPMQLGFDFVLLDDLPIAGIVSGTYANGAYGLEMAFDDDCEDLAPGHLLSIMTIARAIESGRRSYNFNGNYAHYKARMGGVVTTTAAVQIFRTGSLPWARAKLGELRRRLQPSVQSALRFNPDRRRVSANAAVPSTDASEPKERRPRPPRVEERARARAVLLALEARGVRIDRLSGAALERRLPFSTRQTVPAGPAARRPSV